MPVLQHGRQPDGHHLQGQAAARGGAALWKGPAGGSQGLGKESLKWVDGEGAGLNGTRKRVWIGFGLGLGWIWVGFGLGLGWV